MFPTVAQGHTTVHTIVAQVGIVCGLPHKIAPYHPGSHKLIQNPIHPIASKYQRATDKGNGAVRISEDLLMKYTQQQ